MSMIPTPPATIAIAATLRVAGKTWEEIAAKVGRSASRVRDWPRTYAADWARHYRAAETHLLAEVAIEARQCLRQLLRSKDERVQLNAVVQVFKARQFDRAREFQLDVADPVRQDAQILEYIQEVREVDDAELEKMAVDSLRDRYDIRPLAIAPPGSDEAELPDTGG